MLETKSPVMRERAMTRRLAMMEVPVAALKGAAKTVGVTVNDAFLAALTGGCADITSATTRVLTH